MLQEILKCLGYFGWWHEAARKSQFLADFFFLVVNRKSIPIITSRHHINIQIFKIKFEAITC